MFKKHTYDDQDKIREIVADVYGIKIEKLSYLHLHRQDLYKNDPLRFADGTTEWHNEADTLFHKEFYNHLNSKNGKDVKNWYSNFIVNQVSPWFSESFLYQRAPSFRIHLPNLQAIQKWHYDSDVDHGHPLWEINFHIPVTNTFASNAIWIESVPGLKDFSPVELKDGEYTIFDGNRCTHGNKINKTSYTRISFDFRVMPIRLYDENTTKISATTKRRFAIGEYYELYEK
tara:strand:- start:1097 stop:1786 length:690 start_codon:yes stop_codon:yes gene_type:complete